MDDNLVSKEEFMAKVQELIANGDGPFSIAVADIDSFENINKIYGYAIGDEVVKKLISVFNQNLLGNDLMTRHGDEFNLLLVNKGSERSFMEMEEIELSFDKHLFW